MDYNREIITPSKLNNSITTSKPSSLCPFCHNYEKTAKIDVKHFCKKHSNPYSCLVPTCYSVFTSKDILIHHYRSHLNLASNSYLCNICLGILNCSRNESKKKHVHQNLESRLTCCSLFFPTMADFVCHKLLEHDGDIISKKSNIDPLNQNLKRPRKNKKFRALRSTKRTKVEQMINGPKISETPNTGYSGIYDCKLCPTVYSTLSDFVEHSEKSHDISYRLKENEIKLCPLCDENYDTLKFVEHIAMCTNTMKVDNDSLNQYGCIHCQQIFSGITASQFRNHFNYCRSFEVDGIDDNSEKSRRCKNCMFESTNLENCIKHANSYCIYYKLKMKYAKESYEKDKVAERVKSQIQTASDISLVFIKPENADDVKINPSYCDWSRQKILKTFNYHCNSCDKGFFSRNVFLNHLTCKGVKCRSNTLIYCIRCINDFDNVVSFNKHLPSAPPMPSGVPIAYTETSATDVIPIHKPFIEIHPSKSIKVEPSIYELNETTQFYNAEENIVMGQIVANSNANNLQLDDENEEMENLENNDGTLFQESEDFKSDVKSGLLKESEDSVFNNQLFHEIEASDIDLQSIVKIDEDKPNVNLFNGLDSST